MKTVTSLAAALCTSCVLIGTLHIIAPEGAMSRPVKYALSLAFTAAVAATAAIPLGKTDISFNRSVSTAVSADGLYAASAGYVYAALLEHAGIAFEEITVCTDKSDDDGIFITELIIYSDSPREEIINALGTVAENYRVEVINE